MLRAAFDSWVIPIFVLRLTARRPRVCSWMRSDVVNRLIDRAAQRAPPVAASSRDQAGTGLSTAGGINWRERADGPQPSHAHRWGWSRVLLGGRHEYRAARRLLHRDLLVASKYQ